MKKSSFVRVDLFELYVYIVHVDEWKLKKDKILSLVNFNDKTASTKFGNLTYSDFGVESPSKEIYNKTFLSMVNPYLKEFHKHVYPYKQIWGPWCQKQLSGDFHQTHDHGSIGYSAVFYAKINPDVHESTSFISPFPHPNDGSVKSRNLQANEGDLIFFPAHLLHGSIPHKSDEDRIVFSFNLL